MGKGGRGKVEGKGWDGQGEDEGGGQATICYKSNQILGNPIFKPFQQIYIPYTSSRYIFLILPVDIYALYFQQKYILCTSSRYIFFVLPVDIYSLYFLVDIYSLYFQQMNILYTSSRYIFFILPVDIYSLYFQQIYIFSLV